MLFPRRGADDPAAVGRADSEFRVRMDGVSVGWVWNADTGRQLVTFDAPDRGRTSGGFDANAIR